jgi:hypothetical protein
LRRAAKRIKKAAVVPYFALLADLYLDIKYYIILGRLGLLLGLVLGLGLGT